MVDKKYELVKNDTKSFLGKTLFRIKALKDFSIFKKGELGGYIEKEENLSQEGNAWVSDNAMVFGDAWIFGNARVSDNAMVYGDARVFDDAWVFGNARVSGDAWVYGDAWIFGNARVSGDAWVYGDAWIFGNARVSGDAWVFGNAWIFGNARVSGDAWVYGNLKIDFVLCSKFSFEFDWQIKAWQELEKQFKQRLAKGKEGCDYGGLD
jgi:hypothetical protein